MLHQILCALQGKSGSIIKSYKQQMCIDRSITYLHKPEIQIINEICKCGHYYLKITQLIELQSITSSIYRKGMYQGLKIGLKQYINLTLSIQQQYLKQHHFTLSNIRAQLQIYELIMKQIKNIIYYIYQSNMKGGTVINFLYYKYQNSNIIIQKWLKLMINKTITIFINQVNMWILYGLIQDPYKQFFIHQILIESNQKYRLKSKNNIQITNWDMFTIQSQKIPTCLIQIETANKILFIGKIIKILRTANKISNLPDDEILKKIKILFINNQSAYQSSEQAEQSLIRSKQSQLNYTPEYQYNQVIYQGMIQQIRKIIATKIIKFIIKQQNLINQLQKLNDYYLMFKGDFYHHFLQQSKIIQKIPQKQKALKKINQVILHNTLIKLNQDKYVKRLSFELKPLGFSYNTFKNFLNLSPVGNIDLLQNKSIRFNSSGTALWNRNKQNLQHNFNIVYTITFRTNNNNKMNNNKINNQNNHYPTQINLILQNTKEISGSLHQTPSLMSRLTQYISIRIGYQYSQQQKNHISYIIIVYKDIKRNQKEIEIMKSIPKTLNLLNQKKYQVKINYQNDILRTQIKSQNTQKIQIKTPIKINNYIDLQMGRAYLGFVTNINEPNASIDLQNWQMLSKPSSFYKNHWNQLTLNYKVQWPINLIITPDLLQSYSRIHKFLFPIRKTQIQIQQIWLSIPKLIKPQLKMRQKSQQKTQLLLMQRLLASLRSTISLVINNLWKYFLQDTAQKLWHELSKTLIIENDFQDVIRSVKKYTNSIQIMYYFNAPKIHKKITQIIDKAHLFIRFFHNLQQQGNIDEETYNQLFQIDENFNKIIMEFYRLLKDLSKSSTSPSLYNFTQRIQSCINPYKIDKNY